MRVDHERHIVEPGETFRLRDRDPRDRSAFDAGKARGREALAALRERLAELQELLYAEDRHRLLVVLQGVDTSGKDGTIRAVFRGVNPAGVRVSSFKVPSEEEAARDYLWRAHARVPRRGEIAVWNRSHYEDVLVVRVRELVPEKVWRRRYYHISALERMLVDEGATILKFHLHVSAGEQKRRIEARLTRPDKQWKHDPADDEVHRRYDDFMAAYEEMLTRTSTTWAPWYVVPADRKWYRNLVVSAAIVDALEGLEMRWPATKASGRSTADSAD